VKGSIILLVVLQSLYHGTVMSIAWLPSSFSGVFKGEEQPAMHPTALTNLYTFASWNFKTIVPVYKQESPAVGREDTLLPIQFPLLYRLSRSSKVIDFHLI